MPPFENTTTKLIRLIFLILNHIAVRISDGYAHF